MFREIMAVKLRTARKPQQKQRANAELLNTKAGSICTYQCPV